MEYGAAKEYATTVPLRALRESPFNPRKHYDPAGLQELADSIATQGLLQPIVARPLAQADVEAQFEIVFGHRRFRGASLAGVDQVQIIVREYTDEQAALAQLHENAKRADVNAMEEADAIARLESEFKLTPAQIQKAVGISLSSVYNARKLARCHADVRAAVLNANPPLPPQVAVEVARWPVATQPKVLAKLKERQAWGDGAWPSYRDAKRIVGDMLVPLLQAPFALDDGNVLPHAGVCVSCPKRTGNDPAWEGVDTDQCTDRGCYNEKVAAHWALKADAWREAGETVLEGEDAKNAWPHAWDTPRGYVELDGVAFEENDDGVTYRQALARAPKKFKRPKLTHIADPRGQGFGSFMRTEDAEALLAVLKKRPADMRAPSAEDGDLFGGGTGGEGQGNGGSSDRFAHWTEAERALADNARVQAVAKALVAAVASTPRSTDDMRAMLSREFALSGELGGLVEEHFGYVAARTAATARCDEQQVEFEEAVFFDEWLAERTADELGAITTAIALLETFNHGGSAIYGHSQAARAVAIAERYGIDVLQVQP